MLRSSNVWSSMVRVLDLLIAPVTVSESVESTLGIKEENIYCENSDFFFSFPIIAFLENYTYLQQGFYVFFSLKMGNNNDQMRLRKCLVFHLMKKN